MAHSYIDTSIFLIITDYDDYDNNGLALNYSQNLCYLCIHIKLIISYYLELVEWTGTKWLNNLIVFYITKIRML